MDEKELIPTNGHKQLRGRDPEGLLLDQRRYLQRLSDSGDWKKASEDCDPPIPASRVKRWLREDNYFKTAYDKLFSQAPEVARRQIALLAEKAADVAEELLGEMKPISRTFKCIKCGTNNNVTIHVRDAAIRAKMVETIMKSSGVLKDIRKLEMEGEVLVLTLPQKLAMAQLNAGQPISEQMRRQLLQQGVDLQQYREEDVIEGEYEVKGEEE